MYELLSPTILQFIFVKSVSIKHKLLSNSPTTSFQKLFKTRAYKRAMTPTHPVIFYCHGNRILTNVVILAKFLIFSNFSWAAFKRKHYFYLFDNISTQHCLPLRQNVKAEVYKDFNHINWPWLKVRRMLSSVIAWLCLLYLYLTPPLFTLLALSKYAHAYSMGTVCVFVWRRSLLSA